MAEDKSGNEKEKDTGMASAHLQVRREVRRAVPFEIEISGIRNGEAFRECTVTQNVSTWGCGFLTKLELKPTDLVAIRRTNRHPEDAVPAGHSLFEIMRVAKDGDRWLVGAWKMDAVDLWSEPVGNLEPVGRSTSGGEPEHGKQEALPGENSSDR
jgi:hypothetical protein